MKTLVTYKAKDIDLARHFGFPYKVVRFFNSTEQFLRNCNKLPYDSSIHYSDNLLDGACFEIINNIRFNMEWMECSFLDLYEFVKFDYEKEISPRWFSKLSWDEYYWENFHTPF